MVEASLEVLLNVYDVVPPDQAAAGGAAAAVTRLNNLTRNLFGGVGGVFHGAVVIADTEWSFGYCESGSGVYHVKAKENPMYTFRETISLGSTTLDHAQIMAIIRRMKSEWPGLSYDLLSRNCCHFCEQLAGELCVQPVPAWLNRFATTGAAALQATSDASNAMRGIRDELGRLSGESYSWVRSNLQRTVQAVQGGVQNARGLQSGTGGAGRPGAEALLHQAGGVIKAALKTALNGRQDASGAGTVGAPGAAAADGGEADAVAAVAAAAGAGSAAAAAGAALGSAAGGSSSSLASSASGAPRAALPTTALRWSNSIGPGASADEAVFVGSGEALGKPLPAAGAARAASAAAAAAPAGATGGARRPPSDGGAFVLEAGDDDA